MNVWFLKTFHFKGLLYRQAIFFRASNLKMPIMMWNNPCQCFMLMFLDWQYCLNAAKLISQYCIWRHYGGDTLKPAFSLKPVNINEDAGCAACFKESTWWTELLTLCSFKFRGSTVGESRQQSGALLFLRWDCRCAFEQGSSFPSADSQHTAPADDVQKSFIRAYSTS